jgi:ParB family chromosome partitioning protein
VAHLAPGKYQPRTQMDSESLQELADSIRAQGLMQPILVREVAGGYEIIAGERRWRAAQLAGLTEIPVLVREVADDAVAAMALIENIQREDLNAIDEAHGLQRLIQEFGMTHDAVAQAVGKSRTAVSNLLRLLNLSRPVQDMLTAGLIEMGHARALLPLHAGVQRELAHEIETRGLSVREVERRVARLKDPATATPARQAQSRDILRLEEALSDALGMTAHVHTGSKGGGRLTLQFASADELQGLLQRLGIQL